MVKTKRQKALCEAPEEPIPEAQQARWPKAAWNLIERQRTTTAIENPCRPTKRHNCETHRAREPIPERPLQSSPRGSVGVRAQWLAIAR